MRCVSIIAVASFFTVAAAALCMAAEDEPAATVTVRAAPIRAAEAHAPTSFVTVIDATQHAEQMETVSDALAESVGVSVRRFGGLGAFSTVSIRGSSANQVQIYLDGVPLSRARNETVNLSDLPLDSLERIEVYRGTAPVNLGAAGIGGVVNLVTKLPSAAPQSELSASYGSFDTRKVVATHTQQLGGVDFLGHVTYLGSAGNFTFIGRDPSTGPRVDRFIDQTRRNNAFDSVDALLKAGYTPRSGLHVDLTNETFLKDQGVAGNESQLASMASFDEVRNLTHLRLTSSDLLATDLDLAATVFGIYERDAFVDRKHELGSPQDRRDETDVVGGNLYGSYFVTPLQQLGTFAELSRETFSPFNALEPPGSHESDARRLHATMAVQGQFGLFGEQLLAVPTLRYEHVRDEQLGPIQMCCRPPLPPSTRDDDLWSPSAGLQWRPWPWLALRGNIGRFERTPNFTELFGTSGSVVGNPTLRPETALNRDVGIITTYDSTRWLQHLRLEYAYFNNEIDDIIVLLPLTPAIFKPMNLDGARIRGHELVLQATAIDHLHLDVNYTQQDAENRSHESSNLYLGNSLPQRPSDELYTRVELFSVRGKLYYEFNYVSGNFVDRANFDVLASRATHTFGATLQVLPPLTIGFEARNVTGNQEAVTCGDVSKNCGPNRDVAGFPLPGRAFFGTLTAKF